MLLKIKHLNKEIFTSNETDFNTLVDCGSKAMLSTLDGIINAEDSKYLGGELADFIEECIHNEVVYSETILDFDFKVTWSSIE